MTEDHNHVAPRNPWGSPSRDPQAGNAQATSERPEGWKALLHKVWPSSAPSTQPTLRQADSFREVIETVVFVVVLVLLLKSFTAEAFVIPTGSMAETLWGYQKLVDCPRCHYTFPVNCSSEVDPQQERERYPVTGATCPNC